MRNFKIGDTVKPNATSVYTTLTGKGTVVGFHGFYILVQMSTGVFHFEPTEIDHIWEPLVYPNWFYTGKHGKDFLFGRTFDSKGRKRWATTFKFKINKKKYVSTVYLRPGDYASLHLAAQYAAIKALKNEPNHEGKFQEFLKTYGTMRTL
jgi:hypothetical protein